MKVQCIDIGYPGLTYMKFYDVDVDIETVDVVFVTNDRGFPYWYSTDKFITLEEYRNNQIDRII